MNLALRTAEYIKGIQFNFGNFLWLEMAQVRKAQKEGDFTLAIRLLDELIDWCPRGIKKKDFRKRLTQLTRNLAILASKIEGSDMFVEDVVRNRILQKYARPRLKAIINEFCSELDVRGYMEKPGPIVPEGFSHTLR